MNLSFSEITYFRQHLRILPKKHKNWFTFGILGHLWSVIIIDSFRIVIGISSYTNLEKNDVSNFSDGRDINHHTYQHWYQTIFAASTSRHKRNIIDMNYVLESS